MLPLRGKREASGWVCVELEMHPSTPIAEQEKLQFYHTSDLSKTNVKQLPNFLLYGFNEMRNSKF